MKHFKIILPLSLILISGLTSCLKKSVMNIDPEKGAVALVELGNTEDNLAPSTSTYPAYYSDLGLLASGNSNTFNINLNYSDINVAPEDITVTIGIDNDLLSFYNNQNGTNYVMPPSTIFSLPVSAVIKKGTRTSRIQVTVTNNNDFVIGTNYALPIKIVSSSKGTISSNFGKTIYSFGVRNKYDGHYSLKGYTLRSGYPDKTGNFIYTDGMDLITKGANMVMFGDLQPWADLSGVGIGNPLLTINADKSITVSSSGGAYNDPGYNSHYDPGTKTMYISFTWGAGPTSRLATDTLTYISVR